MISKRTFEFLIIHDKISWWFFRDLLVLLLNIFIDFGIGFDDFCDVEVTYLWYLWFRCGIWDFSNFDGFGLDVDDFVDSNFDFNGFCDFGLCALWFTWFRFGFVGIFIISYKMLYDSIDFAFVFFVFADFCLEFNCFADFWFDVKIIVISGWILHAFFDSGSDCDGVCDSGWDFCDFSDFGLCV